MAALSESATPCALRPFPCFASAPSRIESAALFLKRLDVVGFKSFAAKTTAELPPGIVAVVGPNGSGKSNIADAVRWVLGEQSAKAVRARKPEEVIFAGSATRQPLGMAEVSLILDNTDGTIPLDYAEVRVTRRLYRSGESEYLLNNARVRLKDITNYLLHAQLGPDSYSVIGQGSVDELILQRPEERRTAFESAADIRRHHLKLTETHHKLEATQANLVRVNDVIAELAPHVKRLQSQADRASRAEVLSEELRSLLVRYYRHQLREARREGTAAERALEAASHEVARAQAATAEAETARRGGETALVELEDRLTTLRPRVEAQREQARAAERTLAVTRERSSATSLQRLGVLSETDRLEDRIEALRAEEKIHALEVDAARGLPAEQVAELAQARERLAQLQAELQQAQATLQTARRERDAADRRSMEAEASLGRDQQRLRALDAAGAVDSARRAERDARLESLTTGLAALGDEIRTAQERLGQVDRTVREAEDARRQAAERANRAREAARAAATQADRLHGALQALGAVDRGESAAVPPAWETALRGLQVVGFAGELAARVRPLDRLLRGYLSRTVVVADDATAREAHRRLSDALAPSEPAWAILSLEGVLIGAPGARLVATQDGDGPALADWRRQVRDLEGERAAAESARHLAESDLASAGEDLSAADRALASARAARQQVQAAVEHARRSDAQTRTDLERLRREIEQEAQRVQRATIEREDHERRTARLVSELTDARTRRDEATSTMQSAEERVAAIAEQATALQGRLAALEAEHARVSAEWQSKASLLARIRADLQSAESALQTAESRVAGLAQRAEELGADEARAQRELQEASSALGPLEAELAAADQRRTQLAADRRVIEGRLTSLRAAERAEQERRETALIRAQRARDELERLVREVEETAGSETDDDGPGWTHQLRLALDDRQQLLPEEPVVDVEGTRKRIAWLQRELRAVGGVSEGVVQEYRELSERHDFLLQQAEDLLQAMNELRAASVELEDYMRARFAEVFRAVNEAFQASFQTLFGGGEARLVLTDPDNLLATGIDVVARPPGKKLQGLLSLSGGERALTIVALLFGLLKVNPTPFCVLDEVDAALDEANVQRFAELLARFSRQIQFVVVTHNRATMERADAMYGVTMDTAGVSHVFSVKPTAVATAVADEPRMSGVGV